ncbi:MAG: ADP-ribosylglycohydrolase family protein [Methanospirillum sp.]
METERVRGCLLGLAVGDALGAPFEGGDRPERWCRRMEPDGRFPRRAGAVTDDTLEAIAIAESLITCRGFSPPDLVVRLLAGFRAHPEYYGPTSTQVFSLVEAGVDPSAAARIVHEERGSSRTNGPVMRGPPIGIVYAGRAVGEVSMVAARLTHYDPVAGAASGFVNRMASELCRGQSRKAAYLAALDDCRDPETLAVLGSWRAHPIVPSLDALELAHAAVAVFMTTSTFAGAVEAAVNMGGDSDTLGAVTGALAGASYGVGAIPEEWLAPLEFRPRLVELADGLARIAR